MSSTVFVVGTVCRVFFFVSTGHRWISCTLYWDGQSNPMARVQQFILVLLTSDAQHLTQDIFKPMAYIRGIPKTILQNKKKTFDDFGLRSPVIQSEIV